MNVPKLLANLVDGEGSIKVPMEWMEQDALLRADILKDWIYALENMYNSSLIEMKAILKRGHEMKCPPCNHDCNQGRTCSNRQIKQEPVAYFAKDTDGWWGETDKETGIPLYTAPRELSDEEIMDAYAEADLWVPERDEKELIDFARAILKKASEK